MSTIEIITPTNSIYSDDESIYTLDSLSSDSIAYDSDLSNDYYEAENQAYELYLQKLLLEEERKRELLLQAFGYEEDSEEDSEDDSTIVRLNDLSQDLEIKIRTTLYFDN